MGKPKKPKSAIRIRRRWKINPRTKVKESARRYSRARNKKIVRKIVKNEVEEGA